MPDSTEPRYTLEENALRDLLADIEERADHFNALASDEPDGLVAHVDKATAVAYENVAAKLAPLLAAFPESEQGEELGLSDDWRRRLGLDDRPDPHGYPVAVAEKYGGCSCKTCLYWKALREIASYNPDELREWEEENAADMVEIARKAARNQSPPAPPVDRGEGS